MSRASFVGLVCLGVCGCELKSTSPPPAPIVTGTPAVPQAIPSGTATGTSDSQRSFSGMSMLLIPTPVGEGVERVSVEEVQAKLFPGIAADEYSLELLNRLYGNARVNLEPHLDTEKKPGDTETPPKEGYQVSLRGNLFLDRPDNQAPQDGRRSGYFAAARFSRLPLKSLKLEDLAKLSETEPNDVEALMIACNDYLLRKLPGWTIVDGRGNNDLYSYEAPKSTPQEQRAELDAVLAKYLQRFDPPAK